jgi:arsenate reductase
MSLFEILQRRRGRVLFVSEKNACRSQMAEAFARTLGVDVLEAASGGCSPAASIPHQVYAVMQEKDISLADSSTKNFQSLHLAYFDVIVNLGGCSLPQTTATVLDLPLPSPIEDPEADLVLYRDTRDRVETFVKFLVEHFRRAKEWRTGIEQASSPGLVQKAAPQTTPPPLPEPPPLPASAINAAS